MNNKWKTLYNTTEIVNAINNNGTKPILTPIQNLARNSLAYHFNISFPYGFVYYGNLKHSYLTTGSKTDQLIKYYYSDIKYKEILRFVFEGNHQNPDELNFDERLHLMKKSYFFKIYDLFFNKIYKKIIFNSIWLGLSLICFIYFFVNILFYRKIENTLFFLLILCLIAMGSSLIFSLFGNPLPRYAFTTDFSYYLISLLFLSEIYYSLTKNIINAPQ